MKQEEKGVSPAETSFLFFCIVMFGFFFYLVPTVLVFVQLEKGSTGLNNRCKYGEGVIGSEGRPPDGVQSGRVERVGNHVELAATQRNCAREDLNLIDVI